MSNRPVVTASWMEGKRMQWEVIFSAAPSVAPSLYVEYTTKSGKRKKAVLRDQRIQGQAVRGWIYPVDKDAAWSYENAIDSIDALGSDLDDGWSMLLSDGMDWSELPLSLRPDLMTEDGLGDALEGVDRESVTFRTVVGRTTYINVHNGDVTSTIKANTGFSATEAVQLAITENGFLIDARGEIDYIRPENPVIDKKARESMVNDASQHINKCFQYFISPDGKKQYLYLNDGQSAKFVEYDESISINNAYQHREYQVLTKDEGVLSYGGYLVGESIVNRVEDTTVASNGHIKLSDLNYALTTSSVDGRRDTIDTIEDVLGNPASWVTKDIVNEMHLTYGVVSESASSITFEPDSIFKAVYHDGKLTDVSYGETVSVTPGKMIMCMVFPEKIESYMNGTSNFLSALDTLEKPIPINFDSLPEIGTNFRVMNKDFKAPNGVFEPLTPYGAKNITFHGSTFTVAPRIFSTLEHFAVFPPLADFEQAEGIVWAPFRNCPNVEKVDNQGVLTKNTIALLPTALALYDPDHMDNPLGVNVGPHTFDGYPTFDEDCAPKVVDNYVTGPAIRDPEDNTAIPKRELLIWPTAELPLFPTKGLIYWKNAYDVHYELIGPSELPNLLQPVLPQHCPKLKYCDYPLPELRSFEGGSDINVIYGARLFGVKYPDTVEEARFSINVTNSNNFIATKSYLETFHVPEESVASTLNDSRNDLLAPDAPASLRIVNGWYDRHDFSPRSSNSDYYVNIMSDTDSQLVAPPIPAGVTKVSKYLSSLYSVVDVDAEFSKMVPALPATVTEVDGYLNGTFINTKLTKAATIPALPSSVTNVRNYLLVTFGGSDIGYGVTIPALPSSVTEVNGYLNGTFQDAYRSSDRYMGDWTTDNDYYWTEHIDYTRPSTYEFIRGSLESPVDQPETWWPSSYDFSPWKAIDATMIKIEKNPALAANTIDWMKDTYKGAFISFYAEDIKDYLHPLPSGTHTNTFSQTLELINMNAMWAEYLGAWQVVVQTIQNDVRAWRKKLRIFAPVQPEKFAVYSMDGLHGFDFGGGDPLGDSDAWYGSVGEFNAASNASASVEISSENYKNATRVYPMPGIFYETSDPDEFLNVYDVVEKTHGIPDSSKRFRLP